MKEFNPCFKGVKNLLNGTYVYCNRDSTCKYRDGGFRGSCENAEEVRIVEASVGRTQVRSALLENERSEKKELDIVKESFPLGSNL